MTLVQKIKALAKSRGMTIGLVEASLGFSMGLIGKWDRNTPGSDKILKVADFFGTTTDFLLRDDMESPVSKDEVSSLPASYYHLLNGAKELDLTSDDVTFLLNVAKCYKQAKQLPGEQPGSDSGEQN